MAVPKCVAPECTSVIGDANRIFFRFPLDDTQCLIWKSILGFIGNHKYQEYPAKKCYELLRLCDLHFENVWFYNHLKNRLKKDAIPSLFKRGKAKINEINIIDVDDSDDSSEGTKEQSPAFETVLIEEDASEPSTIFADPTPSTSRINTKDLDVHEGSSVQTSPALSTSLSRKQELKKRLARIRLIRTQRKCEKLLKEKNDASMVFNKMFSDYFTENFARVTEFQKLVAKKVPKGVRCTTEFKRFVLSLHLCLYTCFLQIFKEQESSML
ncbi:hypothetical protein AMK59_7041 [Oryctes borbonicus]|uniref:THAP-type domain-containing protein n=1 Tax=Oryctes borbonicus TaxID=1629725 RepID=A0A0T6AUU4_9SCAR|nr:hypothetical protein AMK59_7041 [Oryctes borbonicus]